MAGIKAGTMPRNKAVSMGPRLGRPSLNQLSSNWHATDNYAELRNFTLKVNGIVEDQNKKIKKMKE